MKLIATTSALILLAGSAYAQDAATSGQETNPAQTTTGQASTEQSTGQADAQKSQPAGDGQSSANSQILVPIENDETPVPTLNLMAGQVDDMKVIGADGKEIGEVSDVLGDQNGVPKAVAVEVGGFLGMGEKRIVLMLDRLSLDVGRLRTSLTSSDINDLPEFSG
ncbi:PRC-barrel domain-containing protein [Fulvimarina sp. MAC3]|uniref:PRC-barrel domain-containing protein n=1 Tax=Fulvimarina sp. MAC3 TaxID=3148887 RepID=UPI0031FD1346